VQYREDRGYGFRTASLSLSSAALRAEPLARLPNDIALLRRPHAGMHRIEQFLRPRALDARDVVLILNSTPSVSDTVAGSMPDIELGQRRRPVERFRRRPEFEQIEPAQRCTKVTTSCDSFFEIPGTLARTIFSSRSAVG